MMSSVRKYIYKQVASHKLSKEDAKLMLTELQQNGSQPDRRVAIIGMAIKLPEIEGIKGYWEMLKTGKNCISDFPESRKADTRPFWTENEMKFRKGAYFQEIDKFDANFFRISPKEAELIHPLQRFFLETTSEALEDAGYGFNQLNGTKTGVFAGMDHAGEKIFEQLADELDPLALTGSYTGILASRVSYFFNLKGPGIVIDSACSSGLSAIHLACRALQNHDCDLAIAGGIHLDLFPKKNGPMKVIETSSGEVRTFDKKADGTLISEAVGVVVLKPLQKAMIDRDNIHAVIIGSAINNDGASDGITAPNAESQEEVILAAWKEAKINPETICYIEAHGTGTALGDPIEIKGLTNAFRKYTHKRQFCGIGSVKTNLGHTVAASGVVSVIKVVLSLLHREIPASINFNELNPFINCYESPLYINDKLQKWEPHNSPRRAGVSSFGFSGTNCHIILEEFAREDISYQNSSQPRIRVFTLSAKSKNSLNHLLEKYLQFLDTAEVDFEDLCWTSNSGRNHYNYRLAIMAQGIDELKKFMLKIKDCGFSGAETKNCYYGEYKVVSDYKKIREINEISYEEHRQINAAAATMVNELMNYHQKDPALILNELCLLYIRGAEIDWNSFYKNTKPCRVSLPTYSWERTRCWPENQMKIFPGRNSRMADKNMIHPLIGSLVSDSVFEIIYQTEFSVEEFWVVNEHRVMNYYIVPGTTFLEMIRAVCNTSFDKEAIEIRNLIFNIPLRLMQNNNRIVQIILKKGDDLQHISIVSKPKNGPAENQEWLIHVECEVSKVTFDHPLKFDLAVLKDKFQKEGAKVILNGPGESTWFGPRWFNILQVYIETNEILTELELPEAYSYDLHEYYLHPALLDNAFNIPLKKIGAEQPSFLPWIENDRYLPWSYKNVIIWGPTPRKFYSYIIKKSDPGGNADFVIFDLKLINESGEQFLEITNYVIKKFTEGQIAEESLTTSPGNKNKVESESGNLFTKEVGNEASSEDVTDGFTEIANQLHQIWSKTLGLAEIDIYSTFNDLGGNSLLAVKLLNEINQKFPDAVDITDIYVYPSIIQIAEHIWKQMNNEEEN